MSLKIDNGFNGVTDPDAGAYIAAVEAADGQLLEFAVGKAINDFVVGCKKDGTWNAIKASCILAGARTLSGALIPLVGAAPTNVGGNFAIGDYNRKTGLVGNGSNKSLRTGLLASDLSNTSHHIFFNASSLRTTGASGADYILGGVYNGSTLSSLLDIVEFAGTTAIRELRSGTGGSSAGNSCTINSGLTSSGSVSGSRTSATELRLYQNGSSVALATNSNTPSLPAIAFGVYARNDNGTQSLLSTSRLSFFSFGDGLSQSSMFALHTRVTLLMAGIAAGIDGFDSDAQNYISRVEAADGQPLELGVKAAINQFITGCKADGSWNAIKASCILAGARTLSGALVPLVGTAPTNFNFVAGDYNRKTGLAGNGSTKWLDSNRASNADPQNNHHMSMYQTEFINGIAGSIESSFTNLAASFDRIITIPISSVQRFIANSRNGSNAVITHVVSAGLVGLTRNSGSAATVRRNQINASIGTEGLTSYLPNSDRYYVFARNPGSNATPSIFASGRIAFYSIGESLDLALLDTRVTTLINAIAAAIP